MEFYEDCLQKEVCGSFRAAGHCFWKISLLFFCINVSNSPQTSEITFTFTELESQQKYSKQGKCNKNHLHGQIPRINKKICGVNWVNWPFNKKKSKQESERALKQLKYADSLSGEWSHKKWFCNNIYLKKKRRNTWPSLLVLTFFNSLSVTAVGSSPDLMSQDSVQSCGHPASIPHLETGMQGKYCTRQRSIFIPIS